MMWNSKKVLISLILIITIGLSYSYFEGEKEKKQYQLENEMYEYSAQQLETNDGSKALPTLLELNKKYPNNDSIMVRIGIANAIIGDFPSAQLSFQSALEINPFLQLIPDFNLNYAKILINNDEYSKAKILIDKTVQIDKGENSKKINELQAELEHNSN